MSEKRINRLVFWTGGVILPTLPDATLSHLLPDRQPSTDQRMGIHELEISLRDGQIDPQEFCNEAVELIDAALPPEDLNRFIPNTVDLLPGIDRVLDELAQDNECFLVSDYPRDWLMSIMGRLNLYRWFNQSALAFTAELNTSGDYEKLFKALVKAEVIAPGRSLWIDHNSARTSTAIRQGIDAAICVDANRLYRDLGLWRLVPLTIDKIYLPR
jgi:hypothetical protein